MSQAQTNTLLEPDQATFDEAQKFIGGFSSVILSTVDEHAMPHSSCAPHIINDGMFFVYVSALAKHANTLANGHASLLFIEDEHQAKTLFARTRLTINCDVLAVDPASSDHTRLLDIAQSRHGATIKILRELPDFILYQLVPSKMLFVTGFGAAYDLTPGMERVVFVNL